MRVTPLLAALTALAAFALVVSPAASAGGKAPARYEPRFESAPCPTQFPLPALETPAAAFSSSRKTAVSQTAGRSASLSRSFPPSRSSRRPTRSSI
jgi:hypothetical protein